MTISKRAKTLRLSRLPIRRLSLCHVLRRAYVLHSVTLCLSGVQLCLHSTSDCIYPSIAPYCTRPHDPWTTPACLSASHADGAFVECRLNPRGRMQVCTHASLTKDWP